MGITTGSATSLMKALLQKKPSGQDDIHEKNNYKKKTKHNTLGFHEGTNTASTTATPQLSVLVHME